jgi:hypothetical protein
MLSNMIVQPSCCARAKTHHPNSRVPARMSRLVGRDHAEVAPAQLEGDRKRAHIDEPGLHAAGSSPSARRNRSADSCSTRIRTSTPSGWAA